MANSNVNTITGQLGKVSLKPDDIIETYLANVKKQINEHKTKEDLDPIIRKYMELSKYVNDNKSPEAKKGRYNFTQRYRNNPKVLLAVITARARTDKKFANALATYQPTANLKTTSLPPSLFLSQQNPANNPATIKNNGLNKLIENARRSAIEKKEENIRKAKETKAQETGCLPGSGCSVMGGNRKRTYNIRKKHTRRMQTRKYKR